MNDIKLPPLPVGTTSPMVHGAYYCASDMHDYAHTAIEAYQQRLQDPHAVTLAMCHRTIAPITFDMLAYVLGDAERYAWVIDQRRYIMGEPVALTLGQKAVAAELLECFKAWEPMVYVLGNVRARDGADLMQSILNAPPQPTEPRMGESEVLPGEAVFGFAAWLTSLKMPATFSECHGAAVGADLAAAYNASQGFDQVREDYHKRLKPYPKDEPPQPAASVVPVDPPGDNFGSAEHWKEKVQYWAAEVHGLRQQRGEPIDIPSGWKEQFKEAVYENLAAADNQDIPLEEYPDRILKVLESIVGSRHPTVVMWRNDAIRACVSIAYKYCRDPESHKYLKQDLEALLTTAPQPAPPDRSTSDPHCP